MAIINPTKPAYSDGSGLLNNSGSILGNPNTDSVDFNSDYVNDSGSSGVSQPTSLQELINKIKSTSIYQTVFSVFSSASNNTYWLGQLQSILDSITLPDTTFLDRWNWSQGYDDKVAQIYNDAISQISKLYAQYQEHVNSLPSTAVQQDAIAGINSAITGNIHGSSFSGEGVGVNSGYQMPSTNSLEGVSQIAKFALNTVSGLTGVMSSIGDMFLKFKDLSFRRTVHSDDLTRSFAEFSKSLASDGVILNSKSWSELSDKDPNWNNSASARSKSLYNSWKEINDTINYGPTIIEGINEGYADPSLFGGSVNDGTYLHYLGMAVSDDLREVGKMEFELAKAKARHSVKSRTSQVLLGATPEDVQNAENASRIANSEYEYEKASIFLRRFLDLKSKSDKGDLVAEVQLINMMQNADWQESLVYILGDEGQKLLKDMAIDINSIFD